MTKYVVYLRLSKARKGEAGLGIEAQQRDVDLFLSTYARDPEVLAVFTEIQSGADDDRPELAKALAMVRSTPHAELLVAKLDRLSRRVSFIAKLLEDKRVTVRVACMPNADAFQLHIYAALAEQERVFISKRTIAALAVAKARGQKLGGLRSNTDRRNQALRDEADKHAARIIGVIRPMRDAGKTFDQIAAALETMRVPTARGGTWNDVTVARILRRAA